MSEWNQWYVSSGDATVGPVSTDLVVRGIEHRKIPVEALVCVVGGSTWMSLGTIAVFHAAVVRSYPPPPPNSEDERYWLLKGFHFPKPAPLPSVDELMASLPQNETDDDLVEVDWADEPSVDWSRGFCGYFLGGDPVELPAEEELLESLAVVPRRTFLQDEALWNIALCLAYGSERIGEAAGRAFFDAVIEHGSFERLEWMNRTLLGSGFVPSGIAADAGRRAFERLRALCPPDLAVPLRGRVA
jgi:hypothetical protein